MSENGSKFTYLFTVVTTIHSIFGAHSFVLYPLSHSTCSQPPKNMKRRCGHLHETSKWSRDNNNSNPTAKKKNRPKNSNKRASKQEINSLIKNIGLKPVAQLSDGAGTGTGDTSKTKQKRPSRDPNQYSPLSLNTQLQYTRKGHTVIRNTIPSQTLHDIKKDLLKYCSQQELESWQQKVEVALQLSSSKVSEIYNTKTACQRALEEHSPDGFAEIPFLQHFNTWRAIPSVQALVTSAPLTLYAKTLLDVSSVRLYQDSLFHKRGNDGPTPWHSDARMAPFDTSKMITFWIPLDDIPPIEEGGTGLFFVSGSHSDFALPFWNRNDGESGREYDRLDVRYGGDDGVEDYMPMQIGDFTAHAGWTLHGANGGIDSGERYALAVTYVDKMAEVREDASNSAVGHDEDRRSYKDWIKDVEPRSYFEHDLVPIVLP
jgi:ectoine hydroxylase-related dioxygenase (phytanoyl-CoA dioxygenase family)